MYLMTKHAFLLRWFGSVISSGLFCPLFQRAYITHTHEQPHRIEMLTSYFIFYTGDFLSSACSVLSVRSSFVCICGTNILLIQCTEFCCCGGGCCWCCCYCCCYFCYCFVLLFCHPNQLPLCVFVCFVSFQSMMFVGFLCTSFSFSTMHRFLLPTFTEIFVVPQRTKQVHKVWWKKRKKIWYAHLSIYPARRHHKWLAICW